VSQAANVGWPATASSLALAILAQINSIAHGGRRSHHPVAGIRSSVRHKLTPRRPVDIAARGGADACDGRTGIEESAPPTAGEILR
jgi:hypothetical protein